MVVDQEPEELKTNTLDMVLNRLSPSSLDINTDIKGVNAVFKVPYGAIATDPKANETNFIDALVRLNNTVLFFTNCSYQIGFDAILLCSFDEHSTALVRHKLISWGILYHAHFF